MAEKEIKAKIIAGLETLLVRDKHLLEVKANERSITHRLGTYYQNLFPEWDVDCEYDRNGRVKKELDIEIQSLTNKMISYLEETLSGKEYPQAINDFITLIKEENVIEHDAKSYVQGIFRDLLRSLKNGADYDRELDIWYFLISSRNDYLANTRVSVEIFPDIIVHKRSKDKKEARKHNLLVVEAKKIKSYSEQDLYQTGFDFVKLNALTTSKDFRYKHGLFVYFPVGEIVEDKRNKISYKLHQLVSNPKIYIAHWKASEV